MYDHSWLSWQRFNALFQYCWSWQTGLSQFAQVYNWKEERWRIIWFNQCNTHLANIPFQASKLNEYLKSLMPGLSAKVFRTYNASWTLQQGNFIYKNLTYSRIRQTQRTEAAFRISRWESKILQRRKSWSCNSVQPSKINSKEFRCSNWKNGRNSKRKAFKTARFRSASERIKKKEKVD